MTSNVSSVTSFTGQLFVTTQCICAAIGIVAVLIGCFGNGLVFLAAVESRAFKDKLNIITVSLSTADFILCAFITPMFIYLLFAKPPDPRVFCHIIQFTGSLCALVSILTLAVIAVHRQARIFFHVKNKLNKRQSLIITACVWLASMALALPGTLISAKNWRDCDTNCIPILNSGNIQSNNFVLYFMSPVCVVCILFIMVSYSCIAFTVQKQCRHQRFVTQNSINSTKQRKPLFNTKHPFISSQKSYSIEKDFKAISMCIFVTILILLCWGPLIISQLIEVSIGQSNTLFQVKVTGVVLIFLNSAVNPFIYAQRSGKIKLQLRDISNVVKSCFTCNNTQLATTGNNTGPKDSSPRKSHVRNITASSPLQGQCVDKFGEGTSCENRPISILTLKTSVLGPNIYESNMLLTPDKDLCMLSGQCDLKNASPTGIGESILHKSVNCYS